jgi:peptidase S41-like protein
MRQLRAFAVVSVVALVGVTAANVPPQGPSLLTAAQIDNLVTLGKVWGFVKYHHPGVTGGTIDWDAELLRVIPVVLSANGRTAANAAISRWLEELGPPQPCSICASLPADLAIKPDTNWIHNERSLGHELSARLIEIYRNRSVAREQRYVSLVPGVGNPIFRNENSYSESPLPDADVRLLALYRFWNMIAYWYPYRDLISENWDNVLREFVPKLWSANDALSYRLTLMTLVARIRDGHANLWSALADRPPAGSYYVPVKVRFVEGRFVVTGYLDSLRGPATGLRPGDVILAVRGVSVDSLTKVVSPYYGASNEPSRLREIANALTRGPPGTERMRIERDGLVSEVEATRVPLLSTDLDAMSTHDLAGTAFQLLTPDVAYLKLSAVSSAAISEHIKMAEGTKVFVIDIRNYPKSFVVFALGNHLVTAQTDFARFTHGDLGNPGAFEWTAPVGLRPSAPTYQGQVVILVDETSQSQAEYTAMAFRSAPHALVVGSTTAGADGNVSPIPLPGGLRAMITGIGVFYPDRRPTQRIGIIPDLVVRPTIAGIREGRDEVLEAAVSKALNRPFKLTR